MTVKEYGYTCLIDLSRTCAQGFIIDQTPPIGGSELDGRNGNVVAYLLQLYMFLKRLFTIIRMK